MTEKDFLKEQILQEHSRAQAIRLRDWVGSNVDRVSILIELFLEDEYRITQRIAWVIRFIYLKNPELLRPYFEQLVGLLRKPNLHNAVKRNILGLFEDIEIPNHLYDELVDLCFTFLADPQEAIVVRIFSMTILEKICKDIPELKNELKLIIEDHIEHGSAGFKHRGKKILKLCSADG
jgi:hypothetical protein